MDKTLKAIVLTAAYAIFAGAAAEEGTMAGLWRGADHRGVEFELRLDRIESDEVQGAGCIAWPSGNSGGITFGGEGDAHGMRNVRLVDPEEWLLVIETTRTRTTYRGSRDRNALEVLIQTHRGKQILKAEMKRAEEATCTGLLKRPGPWRYEGVRAPQEPMETTDEEEIGTGEWSARRLGNGGFIEIAITGDQPLRGYMCWRHGNKMTEVAALHDPRLKTKADAHEIRWTKARVRGVRGSKRWRWELKKEGDGIALNGEARKSTIDLVLERGRHRDGCLERLDLERLEQVDWEAYAKARPRARPIGTEPGDGR